MHDRMRGIEPRGVGPRNNPGPLDKGCPGPIEICHNMSGWSLSSILSSQLSFSHAMARKFKTCKTIHGQDWKVNFGAATMLEGTG
eukprot:304838-Karenia_brevis.AAC.1